MRRAFTLIFVLAFFTSGLLRSNESRSPASIAITNVTVIDATGAPPSTEMTVLITGERITGLGKTDQVPLPLDTQLIDAPGMFLIPGLWDMHVHTLSQERVNAFFGQFLANGVIGVRDMGSPVTELAMIEEWGIETANGRRPGPRVVASGPILDGPQPMFPDISIAIPDAVAAREAVEFVKRSGMAFVKVYSLLPRDAYFAIAEEAIRGQISFAGHVPDAVTAAEASDAGQESIEHLNGIMLACSSIEGELRSNLVDARMKDDPALVSRALNLVRTAGAKTYDRRKAELLFARFVENGTWQVPTLVTGGTVNKSPFDQPVSQSAFKLVRAMHDAGVRFMAGTDAPNLWAAPGSGLHWELSLLVMAGLTPMEALQAATRNPAEFLGLADSLGTVEKGKSADLVLLEANPLEDIANTKRIDSVIVRGRIFSRQQLQEMLSGVESPER